uniref:Uncharacterized protein n=1 Tax=Pyrodinium bahamense TaxID=73915 RepID=A0A7S0AWD7_9DINO
MAPAPPAAPLRWMGGEDTYDGLVPFETIVRKGVLVREIDDRKQALVEQCRTNNGLTLQEVIDHNDWLLQIERDLSKARARIERDFRISNALSLKVREGKRKAQLQQRLDVLRAQCDVLNECIHGLSDHCAWFQESGTYREAVEYLEGRWDDDEGGPVEDTRLELRAGSTERGEAGEDGAHHELDGLIHSDSCVPSQHEKKRRKKKKRKGANPGPEEGGARAENSEDDEEGEAGGRDCGEAGSLGAAVEPFASDFRWLRAAGQEGSGRGRYIDVWAPD